MKAIVITGGNQSIKVIDFINDEGGRWLFRARGSRAGIRMTLRPECKRVMQPKRMP
jgi:hypothetical protein